MKTRSKFSNGLIGLSLVAVALCLLLVLGVFSADSSFDLCKECARNEPTLATTSSLDGLPVSERKRRMADRLAMDAPDRFAEFHKAIRTRSGDLAPAYAPNYRIKELQKAWAQTGLGRIGNKAAAKNVLPWKERGPSNVSGRARAVLVDPDDPNHDTWFVGSAGGGVWKTEDAGNSWRELTRDLPNLSTSTLAMSAANPNIIYAGTGEGFGSQIFVYGQGIWKSSDKGESWTQLESTAEDEVFTNTMRIIVDPDDASHLVAATSTGLRRSIDEISYIMKSTDGGDSWEQVYSSAERIEQVVFSPDDFQVQYATINGKGLLKSTDGGMQWDEIFDPFYEVGRLEMAVAPSNPAYLYVAAENGFFASTLFMSRDAGASWEIFDQINGNPPNWLGALGWYSNAISVDPFDEDKVFVGGLDIYALDFTATTFEQGYIKEVFETDPSRLFDVDLVSGAPDVAGRLGRSTDITSAEFIEVEVRWGPGKSQKVHRFEEKWVGTYRDYIDVDFEVWDVTNNRQLMAVYEDEDKDNLWDLSGALVDASERILILNEPYNALTPHLPTTQNAFSRAQYVLTVLSESDEGVVNAPFPEATVRIVPEIRQFREANVQIIADGTTEDGGLSKGVHVDHHQLLFVRGTAPDAVPMLLDANDGGVAVSYDMGGSFRQTGDTFSQLFNGVGGGSRPFGGLNTAQFYGIDKMNGADRYVGGTQDNGSWVSPELTTNAEPWVFAPSGDGFEAVWHYTNPEWIIQSSQFNKIHRTLDGGATWDDISPKENAVFLTRLAKSNQAPNLLFAATQRGVVRSDDFGSSWEPINLLSSWPAGSNATVRISLASPDIVWAVAELGGNIPFFVSVDRGESFQGISTAGLPDFGVTTNLATHPREPETAFALFSFAGAPKILKTTDLGETWTDLSGFDMDAGSTSSTNGFPDVAVYSLLVMPYDNNILWAGTEIGIFESLDGGQNWQYADTGFPAVAVWQMRIVNDQVVVATHGRGVWTVQLPELSTYEPSDIRLSPVIKSVGGGANGLLRAEVQLRETYDSTIVFVDGQQFTRIAGNDSTHTTLLDLDLRALLPETSGMKRIDLSVWGYLSGQALPSVTKPQSIYTLQGAEDGYATDFEAAGDDFILDGFSISQEDGFNDLALHSVHPYPDFQEVTAVLRTPVEIGEGDTKMYFDEIALVESGEPGAIFGEQTFFDYVVVEGSVDQGLSWQPLTDGYDVQQAEIWRFAVDLKQPPDNTYFVNHEIDLKDTFSSGDEVLFRFRMVTDNAGSGWGWVIDNLRIQKNLVISTEEAGTLPDSYTLSGNYPNPFSDETVISYALPEAADVNLTIYDIRGRQVQQLLINASQSAGHYKVSWDGTTPWGTQAASGVYFYQLKAGESFHATRQFVKIN